MYACGNYEARWAYIDKACKTGSDRKRNLCDRMNEFSQSVPDPFCKSNLWISQENWCEKIDDFVENRKKSQNIRHTGASITTSIQSLR
jgi:hypothetical protein